MNATGHGYLPPYKIGDHGREVVASVEAIFGSWNTNNHFSFGRRPNSRPICECFQEILPAKPIFTNGWADFSSFFIGRCNSNSN